MTEKGAVCERVEGAQVKRIAGSLFWGPKTFCLCVKALLGRDSRSHSYKEAGIIGGKDYRTLRVISQRGQSKSRRKWRPLFSRKSGAAVLPWGAGEPPGTVPESLPCAAFPC